MMGYCMGSVVDCKAMYDCVWNNYKFGDVETELW